MKTGAGQLQAEGGGRQVDDPQFLFDDFVDGDGGCR